MSFKEIVHENYTLEIETPEMYVDNEARGRSGHMTHAMAEFKPGCFIDFNSNCSAIRWDGPSPYGWVEYRISRDSGKTYSEVKTLPYSVQSFLDGVYMISVEKAVACDDGSIVALCLRNDGQHKNCCEPWFTPMAIISYDEGKTWTVLSPCYVEKGIRNPQVGYVDGVFVLHGRTANCEGFVLYTSVDAMNWDEGIFINRDKGAAAYYSNNLHLTDEKGNFLLVQYSERYEKARVNVKHLKLRVKK